MFLNFSIFQFLQIVFANTMRGFLLKNYYRYVDRKIVINALL